MRSDITAGLYSKDNAKNNNKKEILSRPLMQEDYYTYCIICRELDYYMLPVYSYLTRQMKSNSLKSGESELSCSKLTLHSFQSEKFMAQIWWSDCKLLYVCINPLLPYSKGFPLATNFGKQASFFDQRLLTSNPQFKSSIGIYAMIWLNWPKWMAVQYLCCTRLHTLYCYNWTIHCFLFSDTR